MFDFVGVGVLVLLIVLFGWLLIRSWGSKVGFLKWGGTLLTGLLTLVFSLVLVVVLVGFYRLNQRHPNPVPNVTVAGTPEQIERGAELANICMGCHSPTLAPPLVGTNFAEGGGPPFGTIWAANLTPAHLGEWSDGEIIRAIREGVGRNGRSLIIMPSHLFHNMSDEDVQSLVAWLRAQPAVEPDSPPTQFNILGAIFINIAPLQTVQEPITEPVVAPPRGPTVEYGEYMVSFAGCTECHGPDLTGGDPNGFAPAGPNLRTVVPTWTEEEFITAMRTGVTPDGRTLSPEMPWIEISNFSTDDDLRAMYAYLHGLRPSAGAQ